MNHLLKRKSTNTWNFLPLLLIKLESDRMLSKLINSS